MMLQLSRRISAKNVVLSRFLATSNQAEIAGPPKNEPVLDYSQSTSQHVAELEKSLAELDNNTQEIPIVINGKDFRTDRIRYQRVPFDHQQKLAKFYYATPELIHQAIKSSLDARYQWERVPIEEKCRIFERAADLIGEKYRSKLLAATIMGQAKTAKQAEIDATAEMADFLRFNVHYVKQLMSCQPASTEFEINSSRFRGLDGFVAAISPFNFTAIGGNLAAAPALLGNTVVWKPSDTAVLSNYITFKLLQEAGFPDGVINFVPSEGLDFGRIVTGSKDLAGINFTGSLATFQWIWSEVGLNIKRYNAFPRLVGECGGKNFHLIHKSAHLDTAVAQTIRSAFEYSGQKCSACSRLYVPESLWSSGFKDKLLATASGLQIGPASDRSVYTSAVIDASAFKRITDYISFAKGTPNEVTLLLGGQADEKHGYFVKPTIFQTTNPRHRLMTEEIFGPVLTVYVYADADFDKTMDLIDESHFALTGAVFAQDPEAIDKTKDRLRMSAGNFYINDKSTGAVVGQQPFGGSRHSGTNDKAGGPHYLMRWCNQQTIKQTTRHLPSHN